jgi:SAM-dependent methyltransferase
MSCPHIWGPCEHEDYEHCSLCASYHSLTAVAPEVLYSDYWSGESGLSTLLDQVYNVSIHKENGKTKNEFVLDKIAPPDKDLALEIGCAPGCLLRDLKTFGFQFVVGIEGDPHSKTIIRKCGHEGSIVFGLFPQVSAETKVSPDSTSLILALDVLEHSFQPKAFLAECASLLKSGGQLFLMLPLATCILPKRFFHSVEHVYIHSRQHIRELLLEVGFRKIRMDAWTAGHETISAYKG